MNEVRKTGQHIDPGPSSKSRSAMTRPSLRSSQYKTLIDLASADAHLVRA